MALAALTLLYPKNSGVFPKKFHLGNALRIIDLSISLATEAKYRIGDILLHDIKL